MFLYYICHWAKLNPLTRLCKYTIYYFDLHKITGRQQGEIFEIFENILNFSDLGRYSNKF